MAPVVLLPPGTLSTIQVTPVLVLPVTVATKALKTLPTETLTVAGATVTLMGPLAPGLPLPRPPQPASKMNMESMTKRDNTNGALNFFRTYTSSLYCTASRSKSVETRLFQLCQGTFQACSMDEIGSSGVATGAAAEILFSLKLIL